MKLLTTDYHKIIKTNNGQVVIDIDSNSGFCFGVVNAINKAQNEIKESGSLLSLGNMVHNEEEVARLNRIGLQAISKDEFKDITDRKVLFRAHGEPPESYKHAQDNNITIIDATCPVVLGLQKKIKKAWVNGKDDNIQIVIFGKKGHAEVLGLAGQTNNECVIIEKVDDYQIVDRTRPTVIFSQTTKSKEQYKLLCEKLHNWVDNTVKVHDTICNQVANRAPKLEEFVQNYEGVIFVGGLKSSNANYLYNYCKKYNSETYFVSCINDLKPEYYQGKKSIGICGATSTPRWLMEDVAKEIENNIEKSSTNS